MYSSTPYYTVKSKKKLPLYIKPFPYSYDKSNQCQKTATSFYNSFLLFKKLVAVFQRYSLYSFLRIA